jgi:leucyl-tRNA synthetase
VNGYPGLPLAVTPNPLGGFSRDEIRGLAARGEAWASIHVQRWPEVDEAAVVEETREVPIQVNGKLRDKVMVAADATVADIEAAVLARDRIREILDGRTPDRIVVAGGGKLVNLVIR